MRKHVKFAMSIAAMSLLAEGAFPNKKDQETANHLIAKLTNAYLIDYYREKERQVAIAILAQIPKVGEKNNSDIVVALYMNDQAERYLQHVSNRERKQAWQEILDFSQNYLDGIFDREDEFLSGQQISDTIIALVESDDTYIIKQEE